MKNKTLKSLGLAVLLLTLLVSNVFAFSLGSTDGVWGRIDAGLTLDDQGATCERYGAVKSPSYELIDGMGVAYNVNVGPGGENERYIRNANVCSGNTVSDYDFAGTGNPAGWVRDVPSNTNRWTGFRSYNSSCSTNVESLIISRYVFRPAHWEGLTYVNTQLAIEIYNNTGNSIGLSGYSLLLFTSDQEFEKIDLSGTIANGGYHIVASNATNGQISNINNFFANNGNYRTVALVKGYEYVSVTGYGDQSQISTIYNTSLVDENQVRYGNPSPGSCPNANGTDPTNFQRQSGFGFEGMIDRDFEPAENEHFPIGRFCHYNNPVSSSNDFESVDLTLKVNEIKCPSGQTIENPTGNNSKTIDFNFNVLLDETTNSDNPCIYGPDSTAWPSYGGGVTPNVGGDTGLNRSGCADMVKITANTNNLPFICVINPTFDIKQEYHLSIMGFTPTTVGADCPDVPVGQIQFNQVYTAEKTNNCFCMYAAYTKNQITPVTLASLGATWTEKGVLIDWETVTETNNFGFNIMRAEIVDGERIQINAEMIFSNLAPGDLFGSSYEYLDETAVPGMEYFYWLVDVPLDSSEPGVFGPISPAG